MKHESEALLNRPILDSFENKYSRPAAFCVFFFPALGGLLFGFDIGATSSVVAQLKSSTNSGVKWHQEVEDSSFLQGFIAAIGLVGAMVGSIVCFQIADQLGRRLTLRIASVLFAVGAEIEFLAGLPMLESQAGISVLMLGRLVYGLGCGFAMHGAPAYIGEMSPSAIRGRLVALKEAFVVLGILLGYSIGFANENTVGGWRWTYASAVPFAVVLLGGLLYIPDSARWLALRGRDEEAAAAMRWVNSHVPDSAVRDIQQSANEAAAEANEGSVWTRLTSAATWPALVAGVGVVFLQQVTGQPSVLYFANSIFVDVGLSTVASIGVSAFKLVATVASTVAVDKYGRRVLLLTGCTLMLIALLMLGTAFLFPYTGAQDCHGISVEASCPDTCSWQSTCGESCEAAGFDPSDCTCCDVSGINLQKGFVLGSMFLYIGGYQVGFGPIAWLLIAEIFP